MSFSKGFENTFFSMMQMGRFQYAEEEEKRAQAQEERAAKLFPEQLSEVQATASLRKEQATELEYKNTDEFRQRETNRTNSLIREANARSDAQEFQTSNVKSQANQYSARLILEDMISVANDENFDSFIESPYFNTWKGYYQDEIERLADQGFDLLSILDHKTFKAFEVLSPIVESGDFTQFDESHGQHLTQIFRGDVNSYLGRRVYLGREQGKKTEMGTAEIVDVVFTGNVQALSGGENAAIEAEYTYIDDEGNRGTAKGFLPDLKSVSKKSPLFIDYDLPEDKYSVSIKDVVDKYAATGQVVMTALQNPNMIKMAQRMNNTRLLSYYPPDTKFDTAVINSARQITQNYADRFEKGIKQMSDLGASPYDFADPMNPAPDELDRYLRVAEMVFPELSFSEQDGNKVLDPGDSIYDALTGAQITEKQAFQFVRDQATVPQRDRTDLIPEMRQSFDFRDISIPTGTPRATYIQELGNIYGTNTVNEQVSKIETAFAERFGSEINDDQLLDQLHLMFGGR